MPCDDPIDHMGVEAGGKEPPAIKDPVLRPSIGYVVDFNEVIARRHG